MDNFNFIIDLFSFEISSCTLYFKKFFTYKTSTLKISHTLKNKNTHFFFSSSKTNTPHIQTTQNALHLPQNSIHQQPFRSQTYRLQTLRKLSIKRNIHHPLMNDDTGDPYRSIGIAERKIITLCYPFHNQMPWLIIGEINHLCLMSELFDGSLINNRFFKKKQCWEKASISNTPYGWAGLMWLR